MPVLIASYSFTLPTDLYALALGASAGIRSEVRRMEAIYTTLAADTIIENGNFPTDLE